MTEFFIRRKLRKQAQAVAHALRDAQTRLVLVESCTGGLVSASLVEIPGISEWLCGSWVVYRNPSKIEWLEVPAALLAEKSAVSPEVTEYLAKSALRHTPEATLAAAITGHLGPLAPDGPDAAQDGTLHLTVATREAGCQTRSLRLEQKIFPPAPFSRPLALRRKRQMVASLRLLQLVYTLLKGPTNPT